MHVFSAVVWLGGLMYQAAVAAPVARDQGEAGRVLQKLMGKRFTGFVWMSAWTMLATGAVLMLLSPRFIWFRYDDRWSILLLLKQILFVLMIVYAYGLARMEHYLGSPSSNGGFNERAELYKMRVAQYRTISVALGLAALLLAAGM